jgi:(5-formylfuran-3-yl)methyl phosphate synthase
MTQLLISVKNVEEALIARYAGVNVIDLKDPDHGALGALSPETVSQILARLKGSNALTSATVGDLHTCVADLVKSIECYSGLGVDVVKISVSDLFQNPLFIKEMKGLTTRGIKLVAVFFAEKEIDSKLVQKMSELGFYGAMLDTQTKSHSLLDIQTTKALSSFIALCKGLDLVSGLAGSINKIHIKQLLHYRPDFIGMRGGVCHGNNRICDLEELKVIEVNQLLLNYNKQLIVNEVVTG